MKSGIFKSTVVVLFMTIFIAKIAIAIAPVFLSMDNKTVNAVIMQLEHESKSDKDNAEKDSFKEKKFFDENVNHLLVYRTFIAEINILQNSENALYRQAYHPTVPTPPPNA